MDTDLLRQVQALTVDEQIELVEAIWEGIVDRDAVPPPTDAQRAELDRRLKEHLANPDDVLSWDAVAAAVEQSLRK